MNPQGAIRFDGWTLQPATGELTRDGAATRLQAQPCTVLVALLERPGQLVTREELINRLWPRGVVDFDTALNSAVRRLRTALGDHAERPRYIETIPKRGYRYIGSVGDLRVQCESPVVARRPTGLRWVAAAALALLCATVAVVGAARLLEGPAATVAAEPSQARELLARAEYFLRRRSPGDLELARRDFATALRLEPGLAQAWAGLASVQWLAAMERGGDIRPGLELTRAAAERALALDPALAVPHLRLANYYSASGDRTRANGHLQAALARDPGNPLALSFAASRAALAGDFDVAIAQQRLAVEAEPLSSASRYNLVSWLLFAGRPEEARAEWARLLEINPQHRDADAMVGLALVLERRYVEALAMARGTTDGPAWLQIEALAYHGLGRDAESDAALQKLIDAMQGRDPVRVAEVYAYRGDPERAFAWLNAAADVGSDPNRTRVQCSQLAYVEHSPFLKPLREDARWRAWRERIGPASDRKG